MRSILIDIGATCIALAVVLPIATVILGIWSCQRLIDFLADKMAMGDSLK